MVQPGEGRASQSAWTPWFWRPAVPVGLDGAVADFGAGAGAAGMAVAARCTKARVTLVESDPVMADFARRTIGQENNAAFSSRLSVSRQTFRCPEKRRVNSGLCDRTFDYVIMNPPFNSPRDRATPDVLKAAAHVMAEGFFESWLRTAAAVLKPEGNMAIIARPASLNDILTSCERRFGGLTDYSDSPRPSEAAIRIVLTGINGSRAGLSLEPPLVLHGESGNGFLARAEAIIKGRRLGRTVERVIAPGPNSSYMQPFTIRNDPLKRLLAKLLPRRFRKGMVEIPVVRLSGMIATGGGLRPSLSLAAPRRFWKRRLPTSPRPALPFRSTRPAARRCSRG